ncbi:uncharacterized protein LOC113499374 isoform X1 [Trichoplusia ni]|uniref:Uncharacterized protein LOC113499374 isoform X1 n=1 Tax=Trichoplusia ni TaxID=7111 RepID=A0A7E5W4T8_TRINI|nr:uncharacterized protein LOC113499374 isoform X1 [Trichoplusia ni]
MKKCSSVVWRFFERIDDSQRCVAVVCKLCETQYKYYGNTTNLRAHLINKHPIQWELSQNGTLDDTHFRIEEDDSKQSTPNKRRKFTPRGLKDKNVRYSVSVNQEESSGSGVMPKIEIQRVDVLENTDSDIDREDGNDSTINLVRQMHAGGNTDEEWLEDDPYQITHIETYEPKRKKMKYRKIKREVASPTGLPGFYVAPKEKKVVYEDPQKHDEYSVFGEYVANKLRKFKTPRTRGNLQQLITTILWQAEYGLYDNADAVKRVLMYSIQSNEPEPSVPVEFETQIQTVQAEEVVEVRQDPIQSNEGEIIAEIS